MAVRVQAHPFDFAAEAEAFRRTVTDAGAIVTFSGIVRNLAPAPLVAMEIEHYPGMTERAIDQFRAKAVTRWSLSGAHVVHRYGRLAPGETIMMVATAAPHRGDAFAGAEFLMDYLKSRAPFWKKEITAESADWVDAREVDEAALARWT